MVRNPYQDALAGRDPVEAMADTPARIQSIVATMKPADLARSYEPGKWTAAQLLVHLAQSELALSTRVRMALSQDGYVAQPFDQDAWMNRELQTDADAALRAYLGLRAMNLALYRGLGAPGRAKAFRHPEHGELDVEWLLVMIAGHELHHLPQLEKIAAG